MTSTLNDVSAPSAPPAEEEGALLRHVGLHRRAPPAAGPALRAVRGARAQPGASTHGLLPRHLASALARLHHHRPQVARRRLAVDKDVVGPTTFVKRCLGGIDKRIGGQLEKRSVVRKIVEEAHVVGWWW